MIVPELQDALEQRLTRARKDLQTSARYNTEKLDEHRRHVAGFHQLLDLISQGFPALHAAHEDGILIFCGHRQVFSPGIGHFSAYCGTYKEYTDLDSVQCMAGNTGPSHSSFSFAEDDLDSKCKGNVVSVTRAPVICFCLSQRPFPSTGCVLVLAYRQWQPLPSALHAPRSALLQTSEFPPSFQVLPRLTISAITAASLTRRSRHSCVTPAIFRSPSSCLHGYHNCHGYAKLCYPSRKECRVEREGHRVNPALIVSTLR